MSTMNDAPFWTLDRVAQALEARATGDLPRGPSGLTGISTATRAEASRTSMCERLTCSHISEEITSRTERAFSRAARRHPYDPGVRRG